MTEVILALDVTGKEEALRIAGQCAPYLDTIKVGYPLILATGLPFARDLAEFGLPLIADFKVADIPNTNRLITEQVFSSGFSAIISHGFTGTDAVAACITTAHDHGGECYVVAEMSHPGAEEFFHGRTAERIAILAVSLDADGIIAPATRPDRVLALRAIVGKKKIYSPGIGAQGGDAASLAGLVDGIIVGRQIYGAADPAAAAAHFAPLRR
jgi:orotidine-5'-phosphate decarboxylase